MRQHGAVVRQHRAPLSVGASVATEGEPLVNAPYQSNTFSVPVLRAVDNATSQANASPAHWEGEWDGATLRAKATAHDPPASRTWRE